MREIDWSKAPEGAVALKSDVNNNVWWTDDKNTPWVGNGWAGSSHHSSWKTIATRPTERKTVKDAVKTVLTGFNGDCLYYSPSRSTWYGSSEGRPGDAYAVCTRAEFEAEVERQKEQEWTHTWGSGKCKIIATDESKDEAWVKFESTSNNGVVVSSRLKPIKPTITMDAMKAVESFAYALMEKDSYHIEDEVEKFRDAHNIEDDQ